MRSHSGNIEIETLLHSALNYYKRKQIGFLIIRTVQDLVFQQLHYFLFAEL